ncbi:hypothetical protein BDY21DRAFT_282175 [Lineolata rhizophorae]|uniref:CUE domain-containing protein n=1 Tax=Lineolata rhizophorae TaxID=578093 RepID=A0A6A6P6M9_9PEZI|nr:hypothetical protein BDY21DRAFT_282175 [Lineolata rhizophorae]
MASKLPPLASFPPATLRKGIPPAEWDACLDAWISSSSAYLSSAQETFEKACEDDTSLSSFLISFFREFSRFSSGDSLLRSEKAAQLRRQAFLLTHRALTSSSIPSSLLGWSFLSDVCRCFLRSAHLQKLLSSVWRRNGDQLEAQLQAVKASFVKRLDSADPGESDDDLHQIAALIHSSPDAAFYIMSGSDFLDSLCVAYINANAGRQLRQTLVTITYFGLTGLTRGEKPKYSLLSDHIYVLKANAEQVQKKNPSSPSLLSDLVTNTPFIPKLRDSTSESEGARIGNLLNALESFRQPGIARPRRPAKRSTSKGKGKAIENGHDGDMHIHRMSKITHVQDLFPNLGSGFVAKLLDEYNDDVETVTANLLDDSLPAHLREADRSEELTPPTSSPTHLSPPSPPRSPSPYLPTRRTAFDNDAFDRLAIRPSQLHRGKHHATTTADALLRDRSRPSKAAILAALATFDPDDDERDDTYDAADVGGTVDKADAESGTDEAGRQRRTAGGGAPDGVDPAVEEALFRAYAADAALFGRGAQVRRGAPRARLRQATGWSDEAIEGWAVMLGRDARRLRRLEERFGDAGLAGGRRAQEEVPRTAWRAEEDEEEGEEEGAGEAAGGRGGRGGGGGRSGRGGGGRGRGRGRGAGGRGGSAAEPADEKGTQVARQRKEANKGSRANHNRRDQRARKMARGGFAG